MTKLKLIHTVSPPTLGTKHHLEKELELEMERLRESLDRGAQALRDDLNFLKKLGKNPLVFAAMALAGGILLSRLVKHRRA